MPLELLVTLTFEEQSKVETKFTLIHSGIPAGEIGELTRTGWNESFDKLDELLKKGVMTMNNGNIFTKPCKQEIYGTYIFDAPREIVYKVFVDPKLIPEWWGPSYLTSKVEKWKCDQVAPGGSFSMIRKGINMPFMVYIMKLLNLKNWSTHLNTKECLGMYLWKL